MTHIKEWLGYFTLFLMILLFAGCGGGGGSSTPTTTSTSTTTTTTTSTTGTISGTITLPSNTNAKFFQEKSSFFAQFFTSPAHAATITNLTTLIVKAGSATTNPDSTGFYTLSVTAGTNIEVTVTAPSGNVILEAIVPSVTAGVITTQSVDTTTTAVALMWLQNKNLTLSQIQSLSTFTNVKNAVETALTDSTVDSIATSTTVTNAAQTAVTPALTSITVSPSSVTVLSSAPQTFTATGVDQFGSAISFTPTFSVTPPDVGTISSSGVFTAAKKGSGIITVTGGSNISASATITVTTGALNSLVISPTTVTLYKNNTQQFTVYGVDASGNAKVEKFITVSSPTWSVTGSIGTIDANGLFTATAQGTGQVKAQTTKSDGTAVSITADVTVANRNPSVSSVSAGSSNLVVDAVTTISATATDADGDTLSYAWSATGGTISGTGSSVTYTAPSTSGTYTITVVATDGQGGSASKTVNVSATKNPTISSGPTATPSSILAGASSTISVTASDPDGDTLSYSWSATGGTISGTTSSVTYTAPSTAGTYTIFVTVSDSKGGSATGNVSVTITTITKTVQKIATGSNHTCALLSDKTIKCWGSGTAFGNGTNTSSFVPSSSVSGITTAKDVSSGLDYSCAVLTDGTVKCWGFNDIGELGDGTTTTASIPVSTTGITNAVGVSTSEYFACAVLLDGTIKCWGGNEYGELGIGTSTAPNTCTSGTIGSVPCYKSPVQVTGITNATSVSTQRGGGGGSFTCATLSGGAVKCWGANYFGQLGNGTNTGPEACLGSACSTSPVSVSGITNAASVSTGWHHACALLSDGTIKCWGSNSAGQLGNGTSSDSTTPVSVSGITNASKISAGQDSTCAVLTDGSVKCWGYNTTGQLGNGTTSNSSTPTLVAEITTATDVSICLAHVCAILSDGSIKCWGFNDAGQLGIGTNTGPSTCGGGGSSIAACSTMPVSVSSTLYAAAPFFKYHFFAFADFVKKFWN